MSEPKQQPKVFLRKPKKSQRLPSDPSSKGDGASGARNVSTASSNLTPPPEVKRPFWYRFRMGLAGLLVLNVVILSYTMFRTSSKPSETSGEAQSAEKMDTEKEKDEKKPKEEFATDTAQDDQKPLLTEKENDEEKSMKVDIEKEKADDVHIKRGLPEPPKAPQAMSLQEISKQKISSEEQQELFKWLLAEKRKIKPANKAEKAQIDAEKALLKEFLRGKSVLNI